MKIASLSDHADDMHLDVEGEPRSHSIYPRISQSGSPVLLVISSILDTREKRLDTEIALSIASGSYQDPSDV